MLTRHQARAAGLAQYSTGKPCKHGHMSPRFVCSTTCVECHRLSLRKHKGPQTKETFGARLAKLRKSRELTQAELAGLARVSARSILHYEKDEKLPHFWQLIELAKTLNTSLDYLCCRTQRRRDFV